MCVRQASASYSVSQSKQQAPTEAASMQKAPGTHSAARLGGLAELLTLYKKSAPRAYGGLWSVPDKPQVIVFELEMNGFRRLLCRPDRELCRFANAL